MTVERIAAMLGWCTLINFCLLTWWVLFLALAHDWTLRLHTKWFRLSTEQFDAIHYSLMGVFKIGVIVFNLVPYLALRIVI